MTDLLLSMIGLALLIILIFLLRKTIFPLIRLWYIILVHGRLSFEFIDFFKEKNLRNPVNNCIRDEITLHFMVFYHKSKTAVSLTTQQKIEFTEVPFMIRYRELRRMRGDPYCINITRFDQHRVIVVGYNDQIQKIRLKSLFYFLNDRFVLGEYLLQDTSRISTDFIAESIAAKYLEGKKPEGEMFYITDPRGNCINYEYNGFSIAVRYLYKGDPEVNEFLDSFFTKNKETEGGFFRSLREEELYNRF